VAGCRVGGQICGEARGPAPRWQGIPGPLLRCDSAEGQRLGRLALPATICHRVGRTCGTTIIMTSRIASPNLLLLPIVLCRNQSSFSLFLILATCCCGPCGVVGDAPASSKRSGKSTGFWGKRGFKPSTVSVLQIDQHRSGAAAHRLGRGGRSRLPLGSGHHYGAAASSGHACAHCKSLRNDILGGGSGTGWNHSAAA
jgi:hypothetical protein